MDKNKIKSFVSMLFRDIIQEADGTSEQAVNFIDNISEMIDDGFIFNKKELHPLRINQGMEFFDMHIFTCMSGHYMNNMIVNDLPSVSVNQSFDLFDAFREDIAHEYDLDTGMELDSPYDFSLRVDLYIETCKKYNIDYKINSIDEWHIDSQSLNNTYVREAINKVMRQSRS